LPTTIWRELLAREPQLRCWFDERLPELPTPAETLAAIHAQCARRHGASEWGQKTPRFIRHRESIEHAFDDVRWILVHRDPRAVVASMLGSGQHPFMPARAVARWRRDNADIVAMQQSGAVPAHVHIVSYETLIRDPQATMDAVFRFLGTDPMPLATLEQNARPVFFSRSRFPMNTIRDGMPPDTASIDAWRAVLSPALQAYIERRCRHEMRILGYEPEQIQSRRQERLSVAWQNVLGALKEPWIVVRYAWYWPEYPIWVLLRKSAFLAARLWK